jgi:ribose/xylose/arabinose/galactoside ABC-type transport system permease subunit
VLVGILCGAACGLFNGFSITVFGMSPFIVTLAAMSMARGLAFIIPNGQTIFGFDEAFDDIGGGLWDVPLLGTLPLAGIISLACLGVGAFILRKTVFGSEVYAVGGNREAALMAGIPVRRTLIVVYLISGALAGLGGVILTGRLDSAQPIAAMGLELNAIAAVVIGGASLFGGRGSMLGTILGVLLIGVINYGLTLNNVEPFWVQFIQGAVIFLAVLFDSLNQKRRGG